MSKFTTAVKARTAITFELDGDEFTFTPPKQASMILSILDGDDLSVLRAGLKWLGDGLSEDQNNYLLARMNDPKDDFDIADLQPIIEWLIEQVGNERPTS